jgi:hypothetical protein
MIPHNLPTRGPEEQEAAWRVLAGGWVAQGAEVEALRCAQPARIISALLSAGIKAIVPIDERDLLDDSIRDPVALALANTKVSLPAYPGLRKDDVARIASIAKEG